MLLNAMPEMAASLANEAETFGLLATAKLILLVGGMKGTETIGGALTGWISVVMPRLTETVLAQFS
jgi:hypothetical protein